MYDTCFAKDFFARLFALPVLLAALTFPASLQAQPPSQGQSPAQSRTPKDASSYTLSARQQLLQALNFADKDDFADAGRGFIAALPKPAIIKNSQGLEVWNLEEYSFLEQETAPPTVNPSLWRAARLNMKGGLFKVTNRIYQVRNFDLSNMTIIEGDSGLIIIDPLVRVETAKAALDLYYRHTSDSGGEKRPVKAVIYSHSHIDHYGGVKGVTSEEDVRNGRTKILAPEGFLEEAASENVFAGNA